MIKLVNSTKNLLLFGCDFFQERKTSELNFWKDTVPYFSDNFQEIVVFSVSNRGIDHEKISKNIYLYNIKPFYIGNTRDWKDPELSGDRFHRRPLSVLYKTYSFLRYVPTFDAIIRRHNIGIVHYMRIFGLFNELLIRRHPKLFFTITVPTHIDRGFPLHYIYHLIKNMALQPMDKIIATTRATKERLIDLGISQNKIEVIHWTSKQESLQVLPRTAETIRAHYGINSGDQIVLWAGPLQDAGPNEFFYSTLVAEKVLQKCNRYTFIFAFKPDSFENGYPNSVPIMDRIKVIETDKFEFSQLMSICDIFLSPVCNKNRTVAPPLTWIEAMQAGIPIITTDVRGTEELIVNGENGFIVDGVEETADLILALSYKDIHKLEESCRHIIESEYDIKAIAHKYVDLWKDGLKWKRKSENPNYR